MPWGILSHHADRYLTVTLCGLNQQVRIVVPDLVDALLGIEKCGKALPALLIFD